MKGRILGVMGVDFVRSFSSELAHTFGDGQGGRPLVSQDVEANAAIAVDVGVVNAGSEVDLGGLEGVICWEVDGKEEDTSSVWRVLLYILLARATSNAP